MKHSTKAFVLWLPLMVTMTLLGWLVFGALPNMRMTSDLIAWLMELPVTTCYAIAAGGATVLTMQVTGINIPNTRREFLLAQALAGDLNARWALKLEAHAWLAFLAVYSLFFFPHW
jgi:hypothetical protein